MSDIFAGKGIFFGNMKGGVGKSTLCVYTLAMMQRLKPKAKIMMIDTDPQATTFGLISHTMDESLIRFMPIGDRFDGTALSMIDGVVKTHLVNDNTLLIVDSAAGKIGNIWQTAMLCSAIIVPTSLSWTDMRPTVDYINEIDERKTDYDMIAPHIIIVPNRVPHNQKDYSFLQNAAKELNVVIAPPVADYSIVKHVSRHFNGIDDVKGTRFYDEVERLAQFIISHVLSGKLDKMFSKNP